MSIIIDKIIECKKYGNVSLKDNCEFCYIKHDLQFKENMLLEDELIFFYCQFFNKIISVEVKQ